MPRDSAHGGIRDELVRNYACCRAVQPSLPLLHCPIATRRRAAPGHKAPVFEAGLRATTPSNVALKSRPRPGDPRAE